MSFCSRIGSLGTRAYQAVESRVLTCPYGVGRAAQNLKAAAKAIPTALRAISQAVRDDYATLNGLIDGANIGAGVVVGWVSQNLAITHPIGSSISLIFGGLNLWLATYGRPFGPPEWGRRPHEAALAQLVAGMGAGLAVNLSPMGSTVVAYAVIEGAQAVDSFVTRNALGGPRYLLQQVEKNRTAVVAGSAVAGFALFGPLGAISAGAATEAICKTAEKMNGFPARYLTPTGTRFQIRLIQVQNAVRRQGQRELLAGHGLLDVLGSRVGTIITEYTR
jgi:hypothetical protein